MKRILLKFPEEIAQEPITSQVVLEQGVPVSIVSAHINSQGGQILLEVPDTHVDKVTNAFRSRGVIVATSTAVEVSDRCFHCGACFSICPVGAINLREDWSVAFDAEKCIGSHCGLCIDSCPARAISLRRI